MQTADTSTELARHSLRHPDGRRLYIYGALRGSLGGEPALGADPPALHRRLDPLTGAWIAVSPSRNTRPQSPQAPTAGQPAAGRTAAGQPAADQAAGQPAAACPLCPGGNEVPFSYDAAVFDNRFPSFMADPPRPPEANGAHTDVTQTAASLGRCEVVLYTEQHSGSLATLDPEQVARVVAVWRDRSIDLWADPDLAYVLIFENRGEAVGATLSHPHGQIYAFDHLPPLIATRDRVLRRHREARDECLTCRVVAADSDAADRAIAGNDSFTVAVPFAPRWPYEVHVRARRHGAGRLGDLDTGEQLDLATALREVVLRYDRLFGFDLPYMMVAHEAPHAQPDWHLSFEFLPPHRAADKLKIRASVETTTGLFINDTMPEVSAAALAGIAFPPTDWTRVAMPRVVPVPPAGTLR